MAPDLVAHCSTLAASGQFGPSQAGTSACCCTQAGGGLRAADDQCERCVTTPSANPFAPAARQRERKAREDSEAAGEPASSRDRGDAAKHGRRQLLPIKRPGSTRWERLRCVECVPNVCEVSLLYKSNSCGPQHPDAGQKSPLLFRRTARKKRRLPCCTLRHLCEA